jgi:hypothetical protein
MGNEIARRPNGTFLPGHGGRTIGARNKLAGEVLDAVLADFREHGPAAIVRVREERPSDYLRFVGQLLPNEILVSAMMRTEGAGPLDDLSPDAKRAIARKLYEQIEAEAKIIEPSDLETCGAPEADEVKSST